MALTDKRTKVADDSEKHAQIPFKDEELENTPQTSENAEFDGDISLSAIRKKKFRIDGDNNRCLELDTSDMSIITRLDNLYPKLQKLSQEASVRQLDKKDSEDDLYISQLSQMLVTIDTQMREILDEIFDSNVSEVCAPSGSMFDPFNGELRFEHIIDVLSKLYENNFNTEFKKLSAKLKKKTSKYTKGR